MAEIQFPCTEDDVQFLYRTFIFDPQIDGYQDGDFTSKQLKNGNISYSCYGEKEFEFCPGLPGTSKLILPPSIYRRIFPSANLDDSKPVSVYELTEEQLLQFADTIRSRKDAQFRSLSEPFACCNSFQQCSDERTCLHKSDSFYNGCHYRRNLEQGRIFYGQNKTNKTI